MNNTIIDRIKGELKTFNDKKKALVEELRKDFPSLIKPLLEQSQLIESISWTQYTPYFNDGDECTFSSHAADFGINGHSFIDGSDDSEHGNFWDKEVYDYSDRNYRKIPNSKYIPHEGEIMNGLSDILSEIPDEFYKDLFGDHVEVTIFKDGTIDVSEYNHD